MHNDTPASVVAIIENGELESDRPNPRAWFATWMLALLAAIAIMDRNIVTLLVDPIKHHFELTDVQMSLLIGAAFAVPFGILGIPAGWAVDRFSRRTVIALGITTWSLATMATGVVRSFGGLVAARSMVGAGDATLGPANSSLISDLFPKGKLALPMAITGMGNKVGQGAALIIGGYLTYLIEPQADFLLPLLGETAGWQIIFLLVGLPGLLFLPLIYLIPEPSRALLPGVVRPDCSFAAFFKYWRQHWRFLLPHHVGFLLLIALSNAVMVWTPAFLIRAHGWSPSMVGGWLGTALLVAPLLGMPLHGMLADILHRRGWHDIHLRYPMITAALGAPIAIFAFLAPAPETTVFSIGLFLFVVSGYVSLPLTALMTVVPAEFRGKAASIVGLVCGAGGVMLGPLLVGLLTDFVFVDPSEVGFSIMIVMVALLPAIILIFTTALPALRMHGAVVSG